MAKQPTSRSGSRTKSETDAGESLPSKAMDGALGGDTVLLGDDTLGEDAVASEPDPGSRVTIEPGDTSVLESAGPEGADGDSVQTEIVEDTVEPTPAAAPVERVVEKTGPGFGPLLIGGVVAAALGYGAALLGLRPNDTAAPDPALTAALEQIETQQGTIAGLQEQITTLANVEPPAAPEVDLSGIEGAIAGVSEDVAGVGSAVEALTGRVVALEDRPIFTGEVAEDSAAMSEAVAALEARLAEERAAAAEAVAEAEAVQAAAAAELQAASDAAQAAIAAAQAEAQATAAATQTQAALSRIRIAMAAGDPFVDALGTLDVDVPEALQAAAETGVPTLEDLQAGYPAAARAALAEANRETAGENVMGGLGAFLQNQIGGRSVVPREGTDPDAVLSRVGAAIDAGDLSTALTEIAALPEGAQALLTNWVGQVQTRADADAALADLAATLDN